MNPWRLAGWADGTVARASAGQVAVAFLKFTDRAGLGCWGAIQRGNVHMEPARCAAATDGHAASSHALCTSSATTAGS